MPAFQGYNKAYQEEYASRSATPLGRQIYAARWQLVAKYSTGGTLLDYGCATGTFHEMAPPQWAAEGWDINPSSPYNFPVPSGHFDTLTLWDVMEHLPTPYWPIKCFTPSLIFIATPNAATVTMGTFDTWKHFKPGEHIHYYTPITLTMSMAAIGYEMLTINYDEGRLRDTDNPFAIMTGVFTKCV